MMKKPFCLVALLALFATEVQAQTLTSKLYGVTGDGGTPSETLFELDMTDASSTLVLTLGNGADGEEIAFNPDDGLIYHASGSAGAAIFETIDPATLTVTPVTLSGFTYQEVSGLTYSGSSVFLASDRDFSKGLSSITAAGVTTNIGATSTALAGLAYVGSTLYAVDKSSASLRIINPATGATVGLPVAITLTGSTVLGATGLATNPVDDTLWALLKIDDTPAIPAERALVVIAPATGVATLVGMTDVSGLAGIAFESGLSVTVTSSVGTAAGSISPLGVQSVISGRSTSFTLTPDTGYVIDSVGGTCSGTLSGDTYTTDAITSDCTVVANFVVESTTKLYGVTGDGGLPAETLFRLDMSDASSTLVLTLGNGNDGEEIAFNPDNGLLYHVSGAVTGPGADPIFETIDPVTLVVTPVPLSGASYKEVSGFTYAGSGIFLASDNTTSVGLSSFSTGGVVTNIGVTSTTLTGLAYIGPTLYGMGKNDALLHTVNPSTGATLGTVAITLSGYTVSGATALTTNPDDNSLWALLKIGGTEPTNRGLVTVDPATGVATLIGIPDVTGLAGIAFEFIPCATCEVTPSVGTGSGTITPSTVQSVVSGATTMFTLNPATNYHIDSVGGTCGGSLVGSTYTTAAITTNCTVVANFTIDTFDLTYTAGTGGSITGTSPQTVDYGGNGTPVTAVTGPNYSFVNWSDGVPNATRTDLNVMADINVTANFAIDTFTVTSSVGTTAGSISPLGGQTVDYNQTTAFTVTPAANNHIDSVDGTCSGSLVDSTYTTAAITTNCTVVANFTIDTFDLTYTAGTGGSITGTSPQTVDYGGNGTPVTAVAGPNYSFVNWSDGVPNATRTDLNVMVDVNVTANFAIDTFTVTSSVGTTAGSISPLGGQTVDYNQTTAFTVTPAANNHIALMGGTCGGSLVGSTYTTAAITTNCTVVANFTIDTFDLAYTAGAGGSVSGSLNQTVDYDTDGTEVTAVADANYSFVQWSDGVQTAARTDQNVMTDINVTANFVIDTFELTYAAGTGGTISGDSPQTVDYDTDGSEVTAVADANYSFVNWSDGVQTASRTDLNVMEDINVTANFAIDTFDLTYAAGSGGSVSGSLNQTVDYDTDGTTVTAVADANYSFVEWSDGVQTASRTDQNVMTDIDVTANFTINTFELTYTAGTGGTITGTSPQTVDYDTDGAEVTAVADANYSFVEWSDGVQTAARTDRNIMADLNVTASFTIDTFDLTYAAEAGGSVSGSLNQTVDYDTDGTEVTAVADANYSFVEWSDGVQTAARTDQNVMTDIDVTANFTIDTFDLTYTAGTGGTISGDSPQTVDYDTDGTEVTAVPDANYSFVEWSDGVQTAARTDLNVMADIDVTANFTINTFELTYTAGTGGSITGTSPQTVDYDTDGVEVTAVADANYSFVEWSDGVQTASRTDQNVMTDIDVTANFTINTFELTYTAGTGGTISGDSPQTVDYGTDGTEVTAVPDANYSFVDWSDGVQTAARTDLNVMAGINVTANFAIDTFTVTSSVGTAAGSVTPLGAQVVDFDETTAFTLTPDANFHIDSVGGTCDGTLVGNTFTTAAITADCTVVANFAASLDTIFKNGFE